MDEQINPQPSGDTQPTQADDASLRELALALIPSRNLGGLPEEGRQLLVGQLPPDFPRDILLLPGARVVGALAAHTPVVVLDTDQSGEEVVRFYREQLTGAGWSAEDFIGPHQGGFLHSREIDRQFGNFYREDGASLTVVAYATAPGRTGVQLTLSPEGGIAMRDRGRHRREMAHDPWRILPPIAPPPHSAQSSEGGSGGGDRVSSSARVETDLDLGALATHYTAQLERAGWQRTNSGESDPVAWSTWSFEDEDKEPWRALFVILRRPDVPRTAWVQVLADWIGKQPQGSGGITTTTSAVGWQARTTISGSLP
ncbi:MAG: hypothetical protein ACM3N4_11215 [Nitrososphaerota archaeon]